MAAKNSIVAEAVREDKLADFWPNYPCLYDVRCPEFKNRELRDKAFQELAEKRGTTCKSKLSPRHVIINAHGSNRERKADSRGQQSLQNQESKVFVSTLQNMLPRWLRGSNNENTPRGNRRRHRPYATASTRDGNSRQRRGQRRVRRSDFSENAEDDNSKRGTEFRRRGRRKTRKKEPIYQGHLNPGYDSERSWDNISIDSSIV